MHVREAFSTIAHALGNPKSRYGALKSTLKTTLCTHFHSQNSNLLIFHPHQAAFMIPPHHRIPSAFPKPIAEMGQMDQSYPSFLGRINNALWRAGNRLVQDDAKYAIKAGIATAMLASFAFWDGTREVFLAFWGDWALISVSVPLGLFGGRSLMGSTVVLHRHLPDNWCSTSSFSRFSYGSQFDKSLA